MREFALQTNLEPPFGNHRLQTLVSRGRCGREIAQLRRLAAGRCELPAILRLTPKSLAASDFFADGEAKNPAISAAEWLRARLRPPWSLRFCDAIFVPLSYRPSGFSESATPLARGSQRSTSLARERHLLRLSSLRARAQPCCSQLQTARSCART